MITIETPKPWNICTPTIFRFLDKNYVDRFFEDGSLRLSTFNKFKKHQDEQRLDLNEGKVLLVLRTNQNGGQTIEANADYGRKAYVLCGTINNDKGLMKTFGCDAGIKINNITEFAVVVSDQIPGYYVGFEGLCFYATVRIIDKDIGFVDMDDFTLQDGTMDLHKFQNLIKQQFMHLPYFLKHQDFAHQVEYRLLWLTDSIESDYLDIKIPEARKFCERI